MLKVLYLPLNTPEGTQSGMYDAWNALGVELHVFDFYMKFLQDQNSSKVRAEFLQEVSKIRPHLVHMQLQFTGVIDYDTLAKARQLSPQSLFVNWSGDIRKNVPPEFVSLSGALDYALISNVGQMELYKQTGCKNCLYWQIGYDPKISHPKEPSGQFMYDISFTGNMYPVDLFPDVKLRLDAARAIRKKFGKRAGVFGNGYSLDIGPTSVVKGSQTNDVYCTSISVLSISNFNDVSHYFSDRLLACMASGRPTISYRFPGSESYFTDGVDLIIVNSIPEILQAVEYCLTHPEEANRIGHNGYKKVLAEHTYTSRIVELIKMLNLDGLL